MSTAVENSWGAYESGNPVSLTLSLTGSVANRLLVANIMGRGTDLSGVAATGWTKIDQAAEGTGASAVSLATFYKIAATDDSFDPTWTGGAEVSASVVEYSGLDSTSPFDVSATTNNLDAGGTTIQASTTPTSQPGRCVSTLGTRNKDSLSIDSGFVIDKRTQNGNYDPMAAIASAAFSSLSAIDPTWTAGGTEIMAVIQATFLEPAGGTAASITGSITTALSVAGTMDFILHVSVAGDIAPSISPGAAMLFASASSIVGDVAPALDVAGVMDYQQHPSILGSVAPALDIIGGMSYASGGQITGDVTATLDVATAMDFTLHAALAGDVVATVEPVALLTFGEAFALVGDATTGLTPAAEMTFTAGGGGSGLSAEQATWLQEIWQRLGLDADNPVTDTPGETTIGGVISMTRTGDGVTSSTVQRDE